MAQNNFYQVVNKTTSNITATVNGTAHQVATGSSSDGWSQFKESGESFNIDVQVSGAPHNGDASSETAGSTGHMFALPTQAYGDNNPGLANSYTVLEVTQNGFVNMYSGAPYVSAIS